MPSVPQVMLSNVAASLGILFNGYIIFVLVWNRRVHNANRLLLFHLAFVDTVFSLVILLYNTSLGTIVGYASNSVTYGLNPRNFRFEAPTNTPYSGLCQANGFFWTLLPIVMIWNICGLSCDRYAALSYPLRYSRMVNVKRTFQFVTAIWILASALATPPLFNTCPYVFWDSKWACTADCLSSGSSYFWYPVTYIVLAIAVPVFVIIFCNLHMLAVTRCQRHGIMPAVYSATLSAQATITHQRHPFYLSALRGKNALLGVVQVVGSLAAFTVPYYAVFAWEATNAIQADPYIISLSTALLTCTPSVNAYVYGVKSRVLRQTLKRLLHQHLCGKQNQATTIKKRLSDIFTDPSGRPPLCRRLSAPADYARGNPAETLAAFYRPKPPKLTPTIRSTSLPFNPSITVNLESRIDEINPKQLPPLERGESAPEKDEIVPWEEDKSMTRTNATWQEKRQHYARSASFPTERLKESCKERKKLHIAEIMKCNKVFFETIYPEEKTDESQESEQKNN